MGVIDAALSDPEGCRKALFHYGAEWGWPACQLGPIKFKEGWQEWQAKLNAAVPLVLGIAWEVAENLGNENPATSRPERIAPEPSKSGESQQEKPVKLEWKTYSGLEPGDYPARVAEIIDEPAKPKVPGMLFEPKPQLRFRFVVLDDQGRDTVAEMSGWCNQAWGPKSKLLEWAQIMLRGNCPKPTEPLDTDTLLNRKVDIHVEVEKEGANPKITRLFKYRTMSVKDEDEDVQTPAGKKAEAAFA